MTPDQLKSWISVVQILLTMGINVISSLKGILKTAQPTLTEVELNAAYVAILTDDAMRADWADRASKPSA